MTFNPTTEYCDEWQFHDFIEGVTWEVPGNPDPVQVTGLKGRWGDFDTPDFQSMAAGLALTSEAAAVVVWQPTPSDESEPPATFVPKTGHILRREEQSNEGWLVVGAVKSRFGHWLVACEKEVVNVVA